MIDGLVTEDLTVQIEVVLVGKGAEEVRLLAEVDTQFTNGLALPLDQIHSLGWSFDVQDKVILGDGRAIEMEFYRGIVLWDGQPKIITALPAESTPLIGVGLLDGYELNIQFKRGGLVRLNSLHAD